MRYFILPVVLTILVALPAAGQQPKITHYNGWTVSERLDSANGRRVVTVSGTVRDPDGTEHGLRISCDGSEPRVSWFMSRRYDTAINNTFTSVTICFLPTWESLRQRWFFSNLGEYGLIFGNHDPKQARRFVSALEKAGEVLLEGGLGPSGQVTVSYYVSGFSQLRNRLPCFDWETPLEQPTQQALINAAAVGRLAAVRRILDRGIDVNGPVAVGKPSALYAACEAGHGQVVKLLLERGADPNRKSGIKNFPLIAAAEKGHTEIVRALLDKGAKLNLTSGVKTTALGYAAIEGHVDTVRLLLSRGADPNKFGSTPLLASVAYQGHVEVAKLLIGKGANVNANASPADPQETQTPFEFTTKLNGAESRISGGRSQRRQVFPQRQHNIRGDYDDEDDSLEAIEYRDDDCNNNGPQWVRLGAVKAQQENGTARADFKENRTNG